MQGRGGGFPCLAHQSGPAHATADRKGCCQGSADTDTPSRRAAQSNGASCLLLMVENVHRLVLSGSRSRDPLNDRQPKRTSREGRVTSILQASWLRNTTSRCQICQCCLLGSVDPPTKNAQQWFWTAEKLASLEVFRKCCYINLHLTLWPFAS